MHTPIPRMLCAAFLLFCNLGSGNPPREDAPTRCPQLLKAGAELSLTALEAVIPEYERSLRAEFPRVHRQVITLFEENPSIFHFTRDHEKEGIPLSELMERVREGTNKVSSQMDRLRDRVHKQIRDAEHDMKRSLGTRDSTKRAHLRQKINQLISLEGLLNQSSHFFYLGPTRDPGPFAEGNNRKWDYFQQALAEWGEEKYTSQAILKDRLRKFERDYRRVWSVLRVAFCVPSLKKVFVKSSELSILRTILANLDFDKYIPVTFVDDSGSAAIGSIRSYSRPIQKGTVAWQDSEEEALLLLNAQSPNGRIYRVHTFYPGGISMDAKQSLEALGAVVHGPVVPVMPSQTP